MKTYTAIALVVCAAFIALASTASQAQAMIKANVPFEFCAGNGNLPAGEYSIQKVSNGNLTLVLSGNHGGGFILPQTSAMRPGISTPKLVFHRYGDEYFLAEIWSSKDDEVITLQATPRERQLAQSATPQDAVVY